MPENNRVSFKGLIDQTTETFLEHQVYIDISTDGSLISLPMTTMDAALIVMAKSKLKDGSALLTNLLVQAGVETLHEHHQFFELQKLISMRVKLKDPNIVSREFARSHIFYRRLRTGNC